jgi:chromosome segregation protein
VIINSIEFRNIKSYGNKIQRIEFDTDGELILLTGTNGAGKSTIQDSIDLALFNQVRGKQTSKIPLKYFPNRLNKELQVSIDFQNSNGDLIEIERKIQPNSFSIKKNSEPFTERFRIMSPDEREKVIGFDYNTFKSFISLSMNDFLNFIKLTPEDKRNLLNRLFNLEEIDDYYSTTKELINQNKKEIERLTIDITNIDKTLKEYKSIIKDKKTSIDKLTKEQIKESMLSKKEIYIKKRDEIKEIESKISNFMVKIQENKNTINSTENENIKRRTELNDIIDKIRLYENGKCPYCMSDLSDPTHKNMLEELKIKREEYKKIVLNNEGKVSHYREENKNVIKQKNIIENSKEEMTEEFTNMKAELLMLKDKYDNYNDEEGDIIKELKEKGSLLIKERKTKLERISELREENIHLDELRIIFSEKGVRKELISSLIPPINESLSKLLDETKYPYRVELDDNFDAIIYDRGEQVYPEIISNGEQRILNVCIAVSYIEMVRKMNNINILFMDEVFQSIHKDNINIILGLLKTFSKRNKLNLILVHHGLEEVDSKIFDRIISVEKDLYSDIKETII